MKNNTALNELRLQAGAIYAHWINGNKQHARAMLNQVPKERLVFVATVCTLVAVNENQQYAWAQFVREAAQ